MPSKTNTKKRKARVYKNKAKIIEDFGFDSEASFAPSTLPA